VHWVDEAQAAGARRHKACEVLALAPRTLQRWRESGTLKSDARTTRAYTPANALSDRERERVLAWSLGRAEVHEIDEINILQASLLAMQRAVAGLTLAPGLVLVDVTGAH